MQPILEPSVPDNLTPPFDGRQFVRDFYDLSKPGIGFYSLLTTATAFWLASAGINIPLLLHTLLGTALVTCGGGALNQVLEIEADARMRRTENRPLPSGRISLRAGLFFGVLTSILGALYLLILVNPLSSLLAIATLIGYLFVYTPLKKKTHLSTLIGAFPGAIPILIGWVAVRGSIGIGGWALFAILFLWQIPHFLAIAWMYRNDYARAGFPMLTVVDPDGFRAAFQALIYSLCLIPVSLAPSLLRMTGPVYFAGALLLGIAFVAASVQTVRKRSNASAKQLLFASIIYLPLLLALMVFDKS